MNTRADNYGKGEIIIREGDIGKSFYKILHGKVGVYINYGEKDQIKLTELNEGQYFGEMAVIETYPRSTTVVAEEPVKLMEIPEEELNQFLLEEPDRIKEIMRHLGCRTRELTYEYSEAMQLLEQIKSVDDSRKNTSIVDKIMKHVSLYNSHKHKLSMPSAESLRESLEKLEDGQKSRIDSYSKGTVIFRKGETGSCLYIVHSGKVGIYTDYGEDNELLLTELMPVEVFGEMGVISEEPRSATAVSDSDDTSVEIIRSEDLETLFKTCPAKIDMILRHLSYRLRCLTRDYFSVCKALSEQCELSSTY